MTQSSFGGRARIAIFSGDDQGSLDKLFGKLKRRIGDNPINRTGLNRRRDIRQAPKP